jgi:hypothetical protein
MRVLANEWFMDSFSLEAGFIHLGITLEGGLYMA